MADSRMRFFLLVLNSHTKEITVIGIPRDIMAEVQIYDEEGNYRGIGTAQLAIQHGYGGVGPS